MYYKVYNVSKYKYFETYYRSASSILEKEDDFEEGEKLTLEQFVSIYEKKDKLLESKATIIEKRISVYMIKEGIFGI